MKDQFQNMMAYEYPPLHLPSGIRVITIEGSKDGYDPIVCSLHEVSLEQHPQYIALSYTWDSQQLEIPITCDGKKLQVTFNCAKILGRLRRGFGWRPTPLPTYIWIDAMCIDQGSTRERNEQVSMMDQIYKNATEVFIWLGDHTPEAERFFSYFRVLQFSISLQQLSDLVFPYFFGAALKWATLAISRQKPSAEDMFDLSVRGYWRRIWTLQEIGLASSRASLFCGESDLLDYPLLVSALLMATMDSELPSGFSPHMFMTHYNVWAKMTLGATMPEAAEMWDGRSASLLALTKEMHSTEPRDKIYALRGLFPVVLGTIEVDYAASVQQVYIDATKAAISNEPRLRVLELLDPSLSHIPLPSWVPDFSSDEHPIRQQYSKTWHAAAESTKVFSFVPGADTLVLRGFRMDVVCTCFCGIGFGVHDAGLPGPGFKALECSKSFYGKFSSFTVYTLREWIRVAYSLDEFSDMSPQNVFRALVSSSISPPSDPEEDLSLFWSVIMAGTAHSKITLEELDREIEIENTRRAGVYDWHKEEWWEKLQPGCVPPDPDSLLQPNHLASKIMIFLLIKNQVAVFMRIYLQLGGKSLFNTQQGRIGLGDLSVQSGDQVFLFAGADVPYIARSQGNNTYRLLGPTNIFGVMEGEAWPENLEVLEDVHIC